MIKKQKQFCIPCRIHNICLHCKEASYLTANQMLAVVDEIHGGNKQALNPDTQLYLLVRKGLFQKTQKRDTDFTRG